MAEGKLEVQLGFSVVGLSEHLYPARARLLVKKPYLTASSQVGNKLDLTAFILNSTVVGKGKVGHSAQAKLEAFGLKGNGEVAHPADVGGGVKLGLVGAGATYHIPNSIRGTAISQQFKMINTSEIGNKLIAIGNLSSVLGSSQSFHDPDFDLVMSLALV